MDSKNLFWKMGISIVMMGMLFFGSILTPYAAEDDYQYNVVPNTPEWKSYDNHAELVEALEIPQESIGL